MVKVKVVESVQSTAEKNNGQDSISVKMNKKLFEANNIEIKNEIERRESSQNQKAANGHGLVFSSQLPTANEINKRHRHI